MSNILTFTDVGFKYHNGTADVLHDINFTLAERSFTILVGASGCGKSTLIKIAAGLAKPTKGAANIPAKKAMVFQSGALLPWFTAMDNVLLALQNDASISLAQKKTRAEEALGLMNMRQFAHEYPRNLSGGQRQRVGIARALAAQPDLLFLDEPFSALDAETTEALHRELLEIWQKRNLTILMISHSLEEAVALGERTLIMHDGRIIHENRVSLAYPRDPTTPEFGMYMASLHRELREKRKNMPHRA
jgi:ABC-type nitrate/sulfonate/bicarbonate transport system ATPase subunit